MRVRGGCGFRILNVKNTRIYFEARNPCLTDTSFVQFHTPIPIQRHTHLLFQVSTYEFQYCIYVAFPLSCHTQIITSTAWPQPPINQESCHLVSNACFNQRSVRLESKFMLWLWVSGLAQVIVPWLHLRYIDKSSIGLSRQISCR